ncbi:MAG: PKD domain-containing protein [Actinomycetota bacterium]|nr:PKD domain-containing protein [Actinomycetota bacterium]
MSWRTRLIPALLVLLLAASASPAMALDISGDDANDQFVGSGQSGSNSTGGGASGGSHHSCTNCMWMAADPCSSEFNAIGCGRVIAGCPAGQEQRRMWFSLDYGLTWLDRGLGCVSSARGAVDRPSAQELHESFVRSIPAAHISSQPSQGVLPQVPTLFTSGQPATAERSTHRIGSQQIQLSPVARWHWDFGDGGALETSSPGSRYPDRTVSHVYRRAGVFMVHLRTTWTATYTVDGQGPFAVEGSVTQLASARIQVGQGRAVLS